MKKASLISDIKTLIKNDKSSMDGKPDVYYCGRIDAYERVLDVIENQGKPKRILPSRELKII